MKGKTEDLVILLGGGILAAGMPALLDRVATPFWPTGIALFVFALIGALILYAAVPEKPLWKTLTFLIWASVFGVFVFAIWERHSLSPVWYGIVWLCLAGISVVIGTRKARESRKEQGVFIGCPRCGKEMRYDGHAYAGSVQQVDAGGFGTRTAQYASRYRCPKCGFIKTE
jgi:predicted RNA-binding Zn-ribbon protein involved in translation (DUF1610 family)